MKCETVGCENEAVCRVQFDSGKSGCYCERCMRPLGGGKSRCGCTVDLLLPEGEGDACLCEVGGANCTEQATLIVTSSIWEPRLGGRYCWMCDECYEEHIPACHARFGMPPEEE